MGDPITKKKEMNFKDLESLDLIKRVIDDAAKALNDTSRTISESSIPQAMAGALGATSGGIISFTALYFGGSVVGVSAAGITSALAACGSLVGGGMLSGIFVLAAPVAIFSGIGIAIAGNAKLKKLLDAKLAIYNEAVLKQNAIIEALNKERKANKERIAYLNGLNILLTQALKELQFDLGMNQ